MAELNWSDGQWQKVQSAVTDAFNKANVANAFLPLYGPLPGGTETVRNERLTQPIAGIPITIQVNGDHDSANLRLVNLTVNVELTSEQVADETLSNALLAFRRAANILALEEDRVVFAGYGRGFLNENSPAVVNQVIDPQRGLADLRARQGFSPVLAAPPQITPGQAVVTEVVGAIGRLEGTANPSPFACVLGNDLFNDVHDPTNSWVLPADRITPMLKGGPLLRSGMIQPNSGIVVSLAAHAVDIVIAVPPTAQFIQRQPNARYLFRVYERFVLRIRDEVTVPVAGFRVLPDVVAMNAEGAQLALLGI